MTQLIDYFVAGGILMWPLLLCSLVAIAVIIERAWRLRRSQLIDPNVVEDIQDLIEKGNLEQAYLKHRTSPSLVGRVLSKGLEEYANTATDIETSLTEAGDRGLQVLSNNLGVLTLVAKVAPLLGLLGTVQGMILGFEKLQKAGVGKESLAGEISIALITTAAGLIIAIPTIVAGAYFRSRIRQLVAEFEEIFIDVIRTVKRSPLQKTRPAPELSTTRSDG
jgi:biopolymer transport protein ExbB